MRRRIVQALIVAIATAFIVVSALSLPNATVPRRESDIVVFSPAQRGLPIVVPSHAIPAERRAAELVQRTLAKAAGVSSADAHFPILPERAAPRRAISIGKTRRAEPFLRQSAQPPFDTSVGCRVLDGAVFVRAERRESIVSAASWFLERHPGVYWFIPGSLGESVPRRDGLVLQTREEAVRPGFVSRDFITGPSEDAAQWHAHNRFEPRFEHWHNLGNIFRPEDYRRVPEMAPWRL